MSLRLSADSPLIAGGDWWLVTRLPDTARPFVWRRHPIAAFTLGRDADGVDLVAVLADGTVRPRRGPDTERTGTDFHQRTDSFRLCCCDLPVVEVVDPLWCAFCAGVTL